GVFVTREFRGKDYKREIKALQLELVAMARWARHHGERIVVLLEGRDTAGKGGTVRAITEHLDTRQYRVVALPKPSEREQGEWYVQRYVPPQPGAGEMVLFVRSWYNRGSIEQMMGFASEDQVDASLLQAPVFEEVFVDD